MRHALKLQMFSSALAAAWHDILVHIEEIIFIHLKKPVYE